MSQAAMLSRMALAAVVSLVAGLVATPVVIAFARRIGFVAKPRPDRWSKHPTALLGGIAIFLAASLAAVVALPSLKGLTAAGAALALIFVVGLVDDVAGLKPQYKLLAQVVAACVLLAGGIRFPAGGVDAVSWPLTLLFVVGITNAMNLLDNMDGLAAGIALVSSGVLAVAALSAGNVQAAILAAALAGACLAFLFYNFSPAKVFMGDCGSMFLGLLLSIVAIQTSRSATTSLAVAVLLPGTALAIPIFDTTFVTVMRALNGRAISQGGCDHTSHRLVKLGLSERQAVLTLYACSLIVGAMGIAAMQFQAPYLIVAGTLAAAWLLVLARFLAQAQVYPVHAETPPEAVHPHGVVLAAERMYKKHTATALVDVLLSFAAFLLGCLLWQNGRLEPQPSRLAWLAAPWAVGGSAVGLGVAGVYRGVWHHPGAADVVRLAVGALFGAVCAGAALAVMGVKWEAASVATALYAALFVALLVCTRGFYLLMRGVLTRAGDGAKALRPEGLGSRPPEMLGREFK